MRIITLVAVLWLGVKLIAQDEHPPSADPQMEASKIVDRFFKGLKSPSPVIPPLVSGIEAEFKKREAAWDPTSADTK
ncbi:MAG: hypothetical protein P1U89_15915 [Verrucomicrobiales bacterium]|nr:hypothetical protein [Verrucomicrobiales bacterium]